MPPTLREDVRLTLPELASEWEGLRIVQVSDLHGSRWRRRHQRLQGELRDLGPVDLAFFTGDYMNHPGDEPVADQLVRRLSGVIQARLGIFGVFGNHDSIRLREMLEEDAPIRWLANESVKLERAGAGLQVLGFAGDRHTRPDALALLKNQAPSPPGTLRLLLSHYPTYLPTAGDLGVHVMFSGHTHGGQVRLPLFGPLYNSSDLPLHLSSGILRFRNTLAVVSRGLGETFLPLRLFCPPHWLVCTLVRGPLPGPGGDSLQNVQPW